LFLSFSVIAAAFFFLRANDAEPSNDVNQDKSPYRNELGIEFN